mmetsp:Transcript_43611/g.118556  ORF Transcript_43611/g.118556 Transcript_43611/m.118556 type:complete len:103 (+) Transcript_43611:358-666(+)
MIKFIHSRPHDAPPLLAFGWARGGGAGGPLSIEKVLPSKQAEAVGIQVGYQIYAVNRVYVATAEQFNAEIAKVKAPMVGQPSCLVEIFFNVQAVQLEEDGWE